MAEMKAEKNNYDVLVIGLGSAGMYAAKTLAAAGKSVAAFEKGPRGTTCILTGCMPSKSLFVPAHHAVHVDHYSSLFSTGSKAPRLDLKKLFTWMRERRAEFVEYRLAGEDAAGFTRIDGLAQVVDAHTVLCNGEQYTGEFIVLCTGSRVFVPAISGLDKVPFFTSDNVFEQETIHGKSIIVYGGGVIGCEMAQFFNSVGFDVTIITRHGTLLRVFDDDVSHSLETIFNERGIKIVRDEVSAVSYDEKSSTFTLQSAAAKYTADNLLVSTGRTPNHPAGLDKAGVVLDKNGRLVRNEFCQTSVPHIYTAGDESGIPLLHEARQEGEYLANHILGRTKEPYTSPKLQVVFSYPHVASVGVHEKDLAPGSYLKSEVSFDEGRSIIEGVTEGKMKLLTDLDGNMIGAACVNDYADHLIQSILPYVQYKMHVSKITDCYHPTQQEVFLDLRDEILAQLVHKRN